MKTHANTSWLGPDGGDACLRTELFVLCDTAQEFDGRLNILGTFETIKARALPINLPSSTVVLRLRFWPSEVSAHRAALRIVDPDGELVTPALEIEFIIRPSDDDRACGYNLIIALRDLWLPKDGEYSFDFYLDGELEARLPLQIIAAKQIEEYAA